ncbi:MAG: hypothetical protein U1E76_09845 [Planctomycetota bacterium]
MQEILVGTSSLELIGRRLDPPMTNARTGERHGHAVPPPPSSATIAAVFRDARAAAHILLEAARSLF